MAKPEPRIFITDRYGGNWPDPSTVCDGQCEGTGCVPVRLPDDDPEYQKAWTAAHEEASHECDGWHFVKCLTCGGTGKRKP